MGDEELRKLAADAAEMLAQDAAKIGGEWGSFGPDEWAERTRIVNALRALAGLPPVVFDPYGETVPPNGDPA